MVSFYEISELGMFHVFQVKCICVYRIGSCLSFAFVLLSTKSSRIFLQRRKEMNVRFLCHLIAIPQVVGPQIEPLHLLFPLTGRLACLLFPTGSLSLATCGWHAIPSERSF